MFDTRHDKTRSPPSSPENTSLARCVMAPIHSERSRLHPGGGPRSGLTREAADLQTGAGRLFLPLSLQLQRRQSINQSIISIFK